MSKEIERKFLVTDESWRSGDEGKVLRQGYLVITDRLSVRVRTSGDEAWLTIKSGASSLTRDEFEYAIPTGEAKEMLERLSPYPIVEKTRTVRDVAGRRWEVDEFHGANAGLVLAEIELESEDATFEKPPWLGKEVTGDSRFFNAGLAKHPFGKWNTIE